MIDALIKRVSITYKCYEMYAHRGKKVPLNYIEVKKIKNSVSKKKFKEALATILTKRIICFGNW
jgi:hypothetical protein